LKTAFLALAAAIALTPAVAGAQTAPVPTESDWRTVAPENLLVIDTSKGRILVEIEARAAPRHAERIRTLADQGFYDGHVFHRVLTGFMAQTGDPLGTGAGGSDLPDVPAEFTFRRGRDAGFAAIEGGAIGGIVGFVGILPVQTQPDAQMMVTADFKVDASGLFCTGVLGMARSGAPDSANSQFFLMMAPNGALNGQYTAFGRILRGLDVVQSLKAGPEAQDGRVTVDPDSMTRVRTAAALSVAERPAARVLNARSATVQARAAELRAQRGGQFSICDLEPVVEITGG
jgi:peptidylprolyl isomerase